MVGVFCCMIKIVQTGQNRERTMMVPRHICADAYRLHRLCSYGRECYIVLSVHYIAEPKVHTRTFNLQKKYHSSKKPYLRTVSNYPNVHHVSHPKSERTRFDPSATQKWKNSHFDRFNSTIFHKIRTHYSPCRRS